MNLRKYESCINGAASIIRDDVIIHRTKNGKPVYGEDTRQDLYVKLLEILPAAERITNEKEAKDFVFICLRNHAYGILNKKKIRQDKETMESELTDKDGQQVDIASIITESFEDLSGHFDQSRLSAYELINYKRLIKTMQDWADRQKSKVAKDIVNEFINPSEETTVKWNALKLKQPSKYKQYHYPPFMTLGKFLGYSNVSTIKQLKKFKQYIHTTLSSEEQDRFVV